MQEQVRQIIRFTACETKFFTGLGYKVDADHYLSPQESRTLSLVRPEGTASICFGSFQPVLLKASADGFVALILLKVAL